MIASLYQSTSRLSCKPLPPRPRSAPLCKAGRHASLYEEATEEGSVATLQRRLGCACVCVRNGQTAVVGVCGSACDPPALEERPTLGTGSESCPEGLLEDTWCTGCCLRELREVGFGLTSVD